MKKSMLMLAIMAVAATGYAQKQPKPKINKANSLRESGELAEAKEIIDLATEYEKTKDDGKTWYYRGLIYATLDTTSNPQYADLSEGALETAMASFKKAEELDTKGNGYYLTNELGLPVLMSQQIENYYSYYFNGAVEAFQGEEFKTAVDNFMAASLVMDGDTNALKNAAYAAHNGELFDDAKIAYRAAIDAGSRSADMYTNLLAIVSSVDKDNEAALAVAQEGKKVHPTNSVLSKTEINLLIQLDKVEEAKNNLITAIKDEPENTSLIFTLAAMYEELGEEQKALDTYDQAIAIDPNHFESNFNKGVILLNRANEIIKQISELGISKADKQKEKELIPVSQEKLKAALPQWEKIYEIKSNDKQVAETLVYIYSRLKMYDKAEDMQQIADKLEG